MKQVLSSIDHNHGILYDNVKINLRLGNIFLINLSIRIEKTQAIMLSQASLLVNFKAETILRIRAMIRDNDHINYIVKKLGEMCNGETKTVCSITDTFFLVPYGDLVLRRCEQYNQGSLIFYKRHFQSRTNLPGSIDNYKCVHFELDLAYALTWVLILSLDIEKQTNRRIYSFLLSDCTHILMEPSVNINSYSVYIQVLLKSTRQDMDKSCNDAIEIIKNLMQELFIKEEHLII